MLPEKCGSKLCIALHALECSHSVRGEKGFVTSLACRISACTYRANNWFADLLGKRVATYCACSHCIEFVVFVVLSTEYRNAVFLLYHNRKKKSIFFDSYKYFTIITNNIIIKLMQVLYSVTYVYNK
jgi:hypothetical protein